MTGISLPPHLHIIAEEEERGKVPKKYPLPLHFRKHFFWKKIYCRGGGVGASGREKKMTPLAVEEMMIMMAGDGSK